MPVSRYDLPADYNHVPFPFDDVMRAGMLMQNQEDKSRQGLIDLGNKQYRSLSKDQERLYKAQQEVNQKINGVYDKYKDKGYRQASDDIRRLRQEVQEREGQFGDIGAMQRNLQSYNEYAQQQNDLYEKEKISKDKRDALLDISMKEYKGVGESDLYGRYNPFTGVAAAHDVNLAKQAKELSAGWKEDAIASGLYEIKDGQLWERKNQRFVKEQEVYDQIYTMLKSDPNNQAYLKQKAFIDLYGKNAPEEIQSQYMDAELQKAATYAAKKEGHWETSYQNLNNRAWEIAEEAKRNTKGQVTFVPTSSTDYKVDASAVQKNAKDFKANLAKLQQAQKTATDPVVGETIAKEVTALQFKIRLQEDLQKSLEKRSEFSLNNTFLKTLYKGEETSLNTKSGKKNLHQLTISFLTELGLEKSIIEESIRAGHNPQEFLNNLSTTSGKKFGMEKDPEMVAITTIYNRVKKEYDDSLANNTAESKDFAQEHTLILGNNETYADQFTTRIQDALQKGRVELLNTDGTQFDYQKQFEGLDLRSMKAIPVKGLIAGKPGFAITAMDSDGKDKKTYYVAPGNDEAFAADYFQTAQDLKELSTSSKYASHPVKSNELDKQANLYFGYATVGQKVQEAQIHIMKPGETRTLNTGYGTMTIKADGEGGRVYYNATLNGSPVLNPSTEKGNFGNEESLLEAVGSLYSTRRK